MVMTSSRRGIVEPGGRHRSGRRGGIVGGGRCRRPGRRTRCRGTDSVCCTNLRRSRRRGYLRPRGCRRRRAARRARGSVHAVAAVVGGVVVVRSRGGEEARLEVVRGRRGMVQSAAAIRVRPTVGVLQRRGPLGRDVQRVVRGSRGPVRVQGVVGDDLQGDGGMVDPRGRSGSSGCGGVVAVVDGVRVGGGGGLDGAGDGGRRGQLV